MRAGVGVAGLQDAQRGDQLLLGEAAAAALVGERGEALDHRDRAAVAAVVGLHAPDRQHHVAVDAVAALDRGEGRGELLAPCPAGLDAGRRGGAVEILPDRLGELGLAAVEPHHLGVDADAAEGGVEYLRRMPCASARPRKPSRQAVKLAGCGEGVAGHRRLAGLEGRIGAGAARRDEGERERGGGDLLQLCLRLGSFFGRMVAGGGLKRKPRDAVGG